MSRLPPQVSCTGPASARLLRALAPFGLVVGPAAGVPRPDPVLVARVLAMPPGSVILCTGPSGCGKSSLLREIARGARAAGERVWDAAALVGRAAPDRPIVDLFTLPLARTLGVLASAGLGEARLWARASGELSEGQRARLGVALAAARVGPRGTRPALLVLDEFCSTLDRVTARGVARTLRRWAGGSLCRVVCATAHEDITADLAPDLHLDLTDIYEVLSEQEATR